MGVKVVLGLLLALATSCLAASFDYRPRYHVTLPKGWTGAPRPNYLLGTTNQYHVFFECNVNSTDIPSAGKADWCHVHSEDFAHWVVDPTPGFPSDTVSGSITEMPIDLRSSVSPLGVAVLNWKDKIVLGTSMEEHLEKFSNFTELSVLKPPSNMTLADPFIWTDGKKFYILVSARSSSDSTHASTVLLYESTSLSRSPSAWKQNGTFWSGVKYDMPNSGFFSYFTVQDPTSTDDKQCMLMTDMTSGLSLWMLGKANFNESKGIYNFSTTSSSPVDYGSVSMASVMHDAIGRSIVIGAISESCSDSMIEENGFSGALTLPRVAKVVIADVLAFPPAPGVNSLRGLYLGSYDDIQVVNGTLDMNAFRGNQLLVHAQLSLSAAGSQFETGINVLSSEKEYTTISIKTDPTEQLCQSGPRWAYTDLPGHDYYHFKMDKADPKECQLACCNDVTCRAWTFTPSQPAAATSCPKGFPCCYLKSDIAIPKISTQNLTSGTTQAVLSLSTEHSSLSPDAQKTVFTAPFSGLNVGDRAELFGEDYENRRPDVGDKNFCNGQGDIEIDMDRPGLAYKVYVLEELDPAKCREYCCRDKGCKAWSIQNATGTGVLCALKNKVEPAAKAAGYISGIGTSKFSIAVDLQIYIDHSIVEVFVNNGQSVLTARAYPTNPDSIGVRLFATNSKVSFLKVEAWEMGSIVQES